MSGQFARFAAQTINALGWRIGQVWLLAPEKTKGV
jgi:hypothetical protein